MEDKVVELIVVIVILAILIGVTIGGIYMYVGQSRVNTDEQNASSVRSTLSTMAVTKEIYELAGKAGDTAIGDGHIASSDKPGRVITLTWENEHSGSDVSSKFTGDDVIIGNYISSVLTNGLPKSQSGKGFTLEINLISDDNGAPNVYVNCSVGKIENPTIDMEN